MGGMDRLTCRLSNGVIKRTDLNGDSVMLRLAAYEDTGMMPDDVAALKAENALLRRELEAAVKQIESVRSCKMCVNSKDFPIEGKCRDCNRVIKQGFEWARPCAENGGVE